MRRLKGKKRKVSRRRKSIFTNLYFSFSVFASILILSTLGFLLFSPRFQVQTLTVSGNKDIPTDQLQKVAEEKTKTSFSFMGFDVSTASIFLFGKGGADVLMENFPEIEKVVVKKNFPNGVSLEVVEKTPFAVWTDAFDNSKKYLIDEKGSFIKNYEDREEYSSLMNVNQKEKIKDLDKKDALSKLSLIVKDLNDSSIRVSSFDMYEEKVSANSNVNCLIIFNINDDLDWQIEKLGIVLKNPKYSSDLNKLKYIDLRFGNQAIIK